MQMILLTALGVGGATVIGAILGFSFKNITHKFSDMVLAFAAGVMLAAAIIGLILPSLEYGGSGGLPVTVIGVFCGAVCLTFLDKLVPHLHRLSGVDQENHPAKTEQLNKVLHTLTPREEHVLKLRFGFEDGRTRTLEEVGKEFNITRERIRQIEAKALRKLRHPSRSKKLKDYLE